jgi:hypothetical protein
MTYIYSPDGTTIYRTHGELPGEHWEQTSLDPPQGTYHELTAVNAESFGYYELVEVPRPDADHVRTVENIGPGQGFTEVWTFSQDLADANADQADRQTKRSNYKGAVATLRQWSDDAEATAVTSGNAVAVLQEMVDRSGTMWDRLADLIEAEHG